MKKLIMMMITAALFVTMSGFCFGHDWEPATCTRPSHCSKCSKTKGSSLGHDYGELNCACERTCARCGHVDKPGYSTGKIPDHNWVEATCTEPETCTGCGKTKFKPLGHLFGNADCKTKGACVRCGLEDTKYGSHDLSKWVKDGEQMSAVCAVCQETFTKALDWGVYGAQELVGKWTATTAATWMGSGAIADTHLTFLESGTAYGQLQGETVKYDSWKYNYLERDDKGNVTAVVFALNREGYLTTTARYYTKDGRLVLDYFNGSVRYQKEK